MNKECCRQRATPLSEWHNIAWKLWKPNQSQLRFAFHWIYYVYAACTWDWPPISPIRFRMRSGMSTASRDGARPHRGRGHHRVLRLRPHLRRTAERQVSKQKCDRERFPVLTATFAKELRKYSCVWPTIRDCDVLVYRSGCLLGELSLFGAVFYYYLIFSSGYRRHVPSPKLVKWKNPTSVNCAKKMHFCTH